MPKNQKKAMFYALIAIAMWSTVASAFKVTLTYFTPIQMLLVATCTTIFALSSICYKQGTLHLLTEYFTKRPLYYLLLGLINPCFYYLILFQAYDLLPAQQAQSLNYTWAISLSILAVPFLGQKLTLRDGVAIVLAYSGALIIATKGDLFALNFSSPLGVFLALLSTLLWAMYWILNARNSGDAIVSLLLCFLLGLPVIVIATPILSDFNMMAWQGWAGAIYIGLFEMGFAFVAWLSALRYAENTAKISNLIFISPFVSLLLLNVIIDEPIFPATIVGLLCIIAGLLIQQLQKNTNKHQLPERSHSTEH